MVTKNLDTNGRLLRAMIAVLLLAYAIVEKSWLALFFSLFVFFEAYMSWCVLYQILGINHCPIDKDKKR
ncbi:MAG: YgaP family membrane protein [Parachlamydiaceae bacterium]